MFLSVSIAYGCVPVLICIIPVCTLDKIRVCCFNRSMKEISLSTGLLVGIYRKDSSTFLSCVAVVTQFLLVKKYLL